MTATVSVGTDISAQPRARLVEAPHARCNEEAVAAHVKEFAAFVCALINLGSAGSEELTVPILLFLHFSN
jgi:uncharacterized MAPEG superfamily protein